MLIPVQYQLPVVVCGCDRCKAVTLLEKVCHLSTLSVERGSKAEHCPISEHEPAASLNQPIRHGDLKPSISKWAKAASSHTEEHQQLMELKVIRGAKSFFFILYCTPSSISRDGQCTITTLAITKHNPLFKFFLRWIKVLKRPSIVYQQRWFRPAKKSPSLKSVQARLSAASSTQKGTSKPWTFNPHYKPIFMLPVSWSYSRLPNA